MLESMADSREMGRCHATAVYDEDFTQFVGDPNVRRRHDTNLKPASGHDLIGIPSSEDLLS